MDGQKPGILPTYFFSYLFSYMFPIFVLVFHNIWICFPDFLEVFAHVQFSRNLSQMSEFIFGLFFPPNFLDT